MNKSLDGNEIRRIRKNLGVNQIKFAEILGISSPYLSAVERGIKNPSQHLTNLILEKVQTGKKEPLDGTTDNWKDEYIAELRKENAELREEIAELRKQVDRLTAPPTGAARNAD